MADSRIPSNLPSHRDEEKSEPTKPTLRKVPQWRRLLGVRKIKAALPATNAVASTDEDDQIKAKPEKWSLGVLNDKETEEVPGTSNLKRPVSMPCC